jgi:hypothetical protein
MLWGQNFFSISTVLVSKYVLPRLKYNSFNADSSYSLGRIRIVYFLLLSKLWLLVGVKVVGSEIKLRILWQ